jgi:hypothetical protein
MKNLVSVEWRDEKTWQLISPESFVKIEQLSISLPKTELFDLCSKETLWAPGKTSWGSWGETKIIYQDVENDEGGALFAAWIAQQYRKYEQQWTPEISTVIVRFYNEKAQLTAQWELDGAFIVSMEFGDVVCGHGGICVNIRYKTVEYKSFGCGSNRNTTTSSTTCTSTTWTGAATLTA